MMKVYIFTIFILLHLMILVACYPPHMLQNSSLVEDKDHLRDHAKEVDWDTMSVEEIRFNIFTAHDFDGNTKLDGCELVQTLFHYHGEDTVEGFLVTGRVFSDSEIELVIDPILQVEDQNLDGYIDYREYVLSQERRLEANSTLDDSK